MAGSNLTTINNTDYHVEFVLVDKQKQKFSEQTEIGIPYSCIEEFQYTDDVIKIGLYGSLILVDNGNIFSSFVFQDINRYLLKVKLINLLEKDLYGIQMYFNIINIENISNKNTSSSTKYKINLVEAFIGEGSVRNFRSFDNGEAAFNLDYQAEYFQQIGNTLNQSNSTITYYNSVTPVSFPNLLSTINKIILTNTNQFDTDEVVADEHLFIEPSEDYKNIMYIDTISLNHFEQEETMQTSPLGGAIYANIDPTDTCSKVLSDINYNFFCCPNQATNMSFTQAYDFGTLRMENIFKMIGFDDNSLNAYTDSKFNGERRIVLKNVHDLFSRCFQYNTVYEVFLNASATKANTDFNKLPKASFYSFGDFNNIGIVPINNVLTSQEWCDQIIDSADNMDAMASAYYRFKDIINFYQSHFLFDNKNYKTPVIFDESHKFRGISRKTPLFEDDSLNEYYTGKILRNIILLNDITRINIIGNLYRKANEIVYIDDNLSNIFKSNTINVGAFKNQYYYITSVNHIFRGSVYTNSINLSTICHKAKDTSSDSTNPIPVDNQTVETQQSNENVPINEINREVTTVPDNYNDSEKEIPESLLEDRTGSLQVSAGSRTDRHQQDQNEYAKDYY